MSGTHGVFQHRTGYFYTILEEDFCELYKADGVNEVCRAYITSILENLTNKQYEATGSDEDIWVFMSIPEMARRMRHAFGERTIHKELQGMIKDGYLQKRRATGKATMEYKLNLKKLRSALDALPEKQPCISATYHLANLQDQSGKNATLTLQNSKNDLAEVQPRISNRLQREEIENTESTSATSDEDRLTRTEIKTAFTHVLPEVQAEVTLRQAQQGDAHATTPSRADTRGSVGAGHRASRPSVDRHAAEAEVAGSPGSQTSRATPRAVRSGDAAREEGISDESHPTRDVSDGALVDATPVRRGVEAVAGASAQSVDTSSSLPPNVDGAVGSAPPSSGPRRSGRKHQQQDVTQAELPPAPRFHLTEQEEAFWGLWCGVWFNKDIPPDLTETAYKHVVKLAPHIRTMEQLESLTEHARKDLEASQGIKRKTVQLGNCVKSYSGWKQAQQKPRAPSKPKEASPVEARPLPVLAPVRGERKR